MGKMSYANMLPPGQKPTTDQSNTRRTGAKDLGGRPTKFPGFKRPTINIKGY